MAWFKVDDKLHSHPKRYQAGIRAMGLWVIAGSWCGDHLTDGFVPKHMLEVLGGKPADAAALVSCGLWEAAAGGWQFHSWQDQNPTRADVDEVREKERQKKAMWRAKKAEKRAEEEF